MSWLPRIRWAEATLCFSWDEAEGWQISLEWGALHLEFTFAWGQP